ncbi:MAG: hypothetical protein ACFCVC_03965 [Acidimicrobiia bacterium]
MTSRTQIRGAETDMSGVRERFGGIDTPAALAGMFTGLGVLVFLGALITAGAGGLEYQVNAIDLEGNFQEVAVVGAIVAALVVFVSFLAGGWAAGRMARYDGGMNGLGAGLWFIFLVAVFGALGAWVGTEYNAFQRAGLPDWFSQFRGDDVTAAAIIWGLISVALVLGGGYLGGKLGEAYHHKVDAALADRAAGAAPPAR